MPPISCSTRSSSPRPCRLPSKKNFPDIKDPRRGTATVDTDIDPKLVVFTINRPASGLAPRLIKLLKPVGFSKVRFVFEDGSAEESLSDEEEGAGEEHEEGASAAPPPPPPSKPAPAAAIDPKALREKLTALVSKWLWSSPPIRPARTH